MEILFQIQNQWKVEIALGFALEGDTVDDACHFFQHAAPWISIAPAWRDFKGKAGEKSVMYGPPAMDISRAMMVGLGEEKALTALEIRNHFAKALVACREMGMEHVGVDIVSLARIATKIGYSKETLARELALAAHLALYRYTKFKQKPEKALPEIRKVSFMLDDEYCSDELKEAVRFAEAEASGICFARNLGNAPSNDLTPAVFCDYAQNIVNEYKDYGFTCKLLNEEELRAEKMGSLLAVGQGSEQESRMAVIEYRPKNVDKDLAPLALIGKGVTFDTGGISLKPSAGMAEMKGDMSGAGAVLGTMESLGQLAKLGLSPKQSVIALIPLVENMPDGRAIKPGDIVLSKKGKSIEIGNTDAEGRLILVDAIAYAEEKYNPEVILDIATLTGACAVALGNGAAGVFATSEELAKKITDAGNAYFERVWHLPLWDHMLEGLKSNVADISNVGSREGGALSAAIFLKQFMDKDRNWIHIDMAAADNADDAVTPKGSTGFGVRILVDFVM